MDRSSPSSPAAASASPGEVARFEAAAHQWWSADGVFKPLHRFNAVRVTYVRNHAAARFGRRGEDANPLRGLRVLDIGCGGGLVAEPIARLGARVTGIDAGAANIEAAQRHAKAAGLAIDYRQAAPEDLVAAGEQPYDLVMAMEVVEHVPNPAAFLAACGRLVRPGGAFAMASLNRTARAWLLGKLGAEYVLRWLPAGTHDWGKFVKPSEAAATLRAEGLVVSSVDGVRYEPLRGRWALCRAPAVNYLMFAMRP